MNQTSCLSTLDPKPVAVKIDRLSYCIQVNSQSKLLIRNISFDVLPGQFCALMGPSGAGKSTLLDLLAARKLDGMWSGSILFNGCHHSRTFARDVAYVLQDDVHISTLTVRETIWYSARTRLPEDTTHDAINARVDLLLGITGLGAVQNTFIGDGMHKGISGGQLKRLSIAVDIVSLPALIFFDEPTSGLDSSIALDVIKSVRQLSNQGRTCIATIHQPSADIFALFDTVALLSEGRLIYYGATSDAVSHFTNLGYAPRLYQNPAEFIIEISGGILNWNYNGKETTKSAAELEALYAAVLSKSSSPSLFSSVNRPLSNTLVVDDSREECEKEESGTPIEKYSSNGSDTFTTMVNTTADSSMHKRVHATTKSTQFRMLVGRTWKSLIRDTSEIKTQVLKSVAVGGLVGIVFYQQAKVNEPLYSDGLQTAEVANVSAILFFGEMYSLIANIQSIPYLCSRHQLYMRELANYTYSASPYWLSQSITIIPMQLAYHVIYGTICYLLCGFDLSVEIYFFFTSLLFLINISSYYFAMFLAATLRSEQLSFALFPFFFMFLLVFAGFSIPVSDVPPMWSWAPWVSYGRWGFEGLMVNEWKQFDTDDTTYAVSGNGNVLAYYGFENFNKWDAVWILLLYVIALMSLTYYSLRPPTSYLRKVDDVLVLHEAAVSAEAEANGVYAAHRSIDNPLHIPGTLQHGLYEPLVESDSALNSAHDKVEPVPLNELSEDSAPKVEHAPGCTLMFRNVFYHVENKSTDNHTNKEICLLNNVFGAALPAEMCALMGSSGAGKSTLLDVLAGRKTTGTIAGEIYFNGKSRSSAIMTDSAYVMQDNVHIGILSVSEILWFAAALRLPQGMSKTARALRVDQLVSMFGLRDVLHTIAGTEHQRGISGGQLKRLSIAVELINLPSLLFLDEPTTGLDSAIAYEVMCSIQKFCASNRTIICTVHQPSPQTYLLFDKLLLLAAGRVVFFGPAKDSLSYFQSSVPRNMGDVFCVETTNPADFIVAVATSYARALSTAKSSRDIDSGRAQSDQESERFLAVGAEDIDSPNEERGSTVAATGTSHKSSSNRSHTREYSPLHRLEAGAVVESDEELQTTDKLPDLPTLFLSSQYFQAFVQLFENSAPRGHAYTISQDGGMPIASSASVVLLGGIAQPSIYSTSTSHQIRVLLIRTLTVIRKNYSLVVANFIRHIVVGAFYGSLYWHLPTGTSQSCYNNRLSLIFFSITFLVTGHQAIIPEILQNRLVFYRERGARAYGPIAYWVSCWVIEIPLIVLNVTAFSLAVVYMTQLRANVEAVIFFTAVLVINSIVGLFICHVIAAISPSSQAAVSLYPIFLFFSVAFGGFIVYIPQFPSWLGSWAPYGSFMRYSMQALVLNEFKDNPDLPLSEQYIDMLGFNGMTKEQCAPLLILFVGVFSVLFLLALRYVDFEVR